MLRGRVVVAVVIIDSKPPASLLEVSSLDHPQHFFLRNCSPSPCVLGKAPRKQLATKAARKTAVVSVTFPLPSTSGLVV